MQLALALGHGQRVVGQGKVVHANVAVALAEEALDRALQHLHARRRQRQIGRDDAPLRLEARGQVRVGVERDAVGAQGADLLDGAGKRSRGLQRQAEDQVGIDRDEAERARMLDQRPHHRFALLAVHGLLHRGVEILHAEADAVEAELAQCGQAAGIDGAWIDFDRQLGIGRQRKGAFQ